MVFVSEESSRMHTIVLGCWTSLLADAANVGHPEIDGPGSVETGSIFELLDLHDAVSHLVRTNQSEVFKVEKVPDVGISRQARAVTNYTHGLDASLHAPHGPPRMTS